MTLTLADILPSAAAALGVEGFHDCLGITPVNHAVVCLIDGLGWHQLQQFSGSAPFLAQQTARTPMETAFPSTTPAGLASLGTGLLSGQHGMVGASFLLPESGRVLSPLQWGGDPVPVAVQPEPTIFEAVARSGRRVVTIAPGAYQHSGLTRAALRGSTYRPSEDIEARVLELRRVLSDDRQSLTYVYWADLDRTGHEFGIGSDRWRAALATADQLVERLHAELPNDAAMIVTADHGMVDCPLECRLSIDLTPGLRDDVVHVAGEPRLRHIYTRPGAQADVIGRWQAILGNRIQVLSRQELIDTGRLGPVDDMISERIGDLVAVAEGQWMLTSHTDARVSSLIGQHGSWTPDEMDIPAVIVRRG